MATLTEERSGPAWAVAQLAAGAAGSALAIEAAKRLGEPEAAETVRAEAEQPEAAEAPVGSTS